MGDFQPQGLPQASCLVLAQTQSCPTSYILTHRQDGSGGTTASVGCSLEECWTVSSQILLWCWLGFYFLAQRKKKIKLGFPLFHFIVSFWARLWAFLRKPLNSPIKSSHHKATRSTASVVCCSATIRSCSSAWLRFT